MAADADLMMSSCRAT